MSFPTFIKTSFVLSGLLSLKLEGIPDGQGGFSSVETTLPIKAECVNQSISAQVSNFVESQSFTRKRPSFNLKFPFFAPYPGTSKKETEISKTKISIQSYQPRGYLPPKGKDMRVHPVSSPSPKPVDVKDINITRFSSCKEAQCQKNEQCVTWKKSEEEAEENIDFSSTSECIPKDGDYSEKLNPKQSSLCEEGETHSIVFEPQPCLRKDPPCPLVWKYQCVNETESPHNCKLKSCATGGCIEQIRCEVDPPCIIDAVCLPSYLIPPYL